VPLSKVSLNKDAKEWLYFILEWYLVIKKLIILEENLIFINIINILLLEYFVYIINSGGFVMGH
jgi:hypothetical protein